MCQTRRVDEKFEADAETSSKESTHPSTFLFSLPTPHLEIGASGTQKVSAIVCLP
jgi:hypothetical protein